MQTGDSAVTAAAAGLRIVGLDLSLTGTGIADGDHLRTLRTGLIGPARLAALRDEILRVVLGVGTLPWTQAPAEPASLTVIEGYSYGSKGSSAYQLGELGGVIRLGL